MNVLTTEEFLSLGNNNMCDLMQMKLRTKIILEQESVLSAKEKERVALLALVEDQRRKIEHLESVEQQLSLSLKTETAKLTEKEAMLSNNTNCKFNPVIALYGLQIYFFF
jgi:hypothetical protein